MDDQDGNFVRQSQYSNQEHQQQYFQKQYKIQEPQHDNVNIIAHGCLEESHESPELSEDEAFIAFCTNSSSLLNNDGHYHVNKLYRPLSGSQDNFHNNMQDDDQQHQRLADQDDESILYDELRLIQSSAQQLIPRDSEQQRQTSDLRKILQDDEGDDDYYDFEDGYNDQSCLERQDPLDRLQLTTIIESFYNEFSSSPLTEKQKPEQHTNINTHEQRNQPDSTAEHSTSPQQHNLAYTLEDAESSSISSNNIINNIYQTTQSGHQGAQIDYAPLDSQLGSAKCVSEQNSKSADTDRGVDGAPDEGGCQSSRSESSSSSGAAVAKTSMSKCRRRTANARERIRMREINQAFEKLKQVVPIEMIQQHQATEGDESDQTSVSSHRLRAGNKTSSSSPSTSQQSSDSIKLTKITTLRLAVSYISKLSELLQEQPDEGTPTSSPSKLATHGDNNQSQHSKAPSPSKKRKLSRQTTSCSKKQADFNKQHLSDPSSKTKKCKTNVNSNTTTSALEDDGSGSNQQITDYNNQQQKILIATDLQQNRNRQPTQTRFITIPSHHFQPVAQKQITGQSQQQLMIAHTNTNTNGNNNHDRSYVTPVAVAILGIPSGAANVATNQTFVDAQRVSGTNSIQLIGFHGPLKTTQQSNYNHLTQQQPQQVMLTLSDMNGLSMLRLANPSAIATTSAGVQSNTQTFCGPNQFNIQPTRQQYLATTHPQAATINYAYRPIKITQPNSAIQQQRSNNDQNVVRICELLSSDFEQNQAHNTQQMNQISTNQQSTSGKTVNHVITNMTTRASTGTNENAKNSNISHQQQVQVQMRTTNGSPTTATSQVGHNPAYYEQQQTSSANQQTSSPLTQAIFRSSTDGAANLVAITSSGQQIPLSTATAYNAINQATDNSAKFVLLNHHTLKHTQAHQEHQASQTASAIGQCRDQGQLDGQRSTIDVSRIDCQSQIEAEQQQLLGQQMKFVNHFTHAPTVKTVDQDQRDVISAEANISKLVANLATSIQPPSVSSSSGQCEASFENNHSINNKIIQQIDTQHQARQQPVKRTYRFHNYDGSMITNHLYHNQSNSNGNNVDESTGTCHQRQVSKKASSTDKQIGGGTSDGVASTRDVTSGANNGRQRSRQNSLSSVCSSASSSSSSLMTSSVAGNISPNMPVVSIMIKSPATHQNGASKEPIEAIPETLLVSNTSAA